MPFIKRRIAKFLTDTMYNDEFSHTIIHRNPDKNRMAFTELLDKAAAAPPAAAPKASRQRAGAGSASRVGSAASRPGTGGGVKKPAPSKSRVAGRSKAAVRPVGAKQYSDPAAK
jgi:NIMA (never in mitosis gene a)-related kinase